MDSPNLSVWPGVVVPIPLVSRRAVTARGDSVRFGVEVEPVELSHEFVLRELLDFEADDADTGTGQLLEFVSAWGSPLAGSRDNVKVAELHAALTRLQSMVRLWIDVAEQPLDESPRGGGHGQTLAEQLNDGLSRVRLLATTGTLPTVDLAAASCLQLHNLIVDVAEGTPLQRCHNERCGRAFLRQHDLPERTKHRVKGLKFCSNRCARNQAKREFHRRQKKETH